MTDEHDDQPAETARDRILRDYPELVEQARRRIAFENLLEALGIEATNEDDDW